MAFPSLAPSTGSPLALFPHKEGLRFFYRKAFCGPSPSQGLEKGDQNPSREGGVWSGGEAWGGDEEEEKMPEVTHMEAVPLYFLSLSFSPWIQRGIRRDEQGRGASGKKKGRETDERAGCRAGGEGPSPAGWVASPPFAFLASANLGPRSIPRGDL